MGILRKIGLAIAAMLPVTGIAGAVCAEVPKNWQLGFDPPASPTMERIIEFHDLLLVIITLITIFVTVLLLYVLYRFSEKRNPTPSRTTHNTTIEVLWTVIPVVILVIVAIPSFKLLYYADRAEDAEMTIKAIGHQWYWSYEYPDDGNFTFDAVMVADEDLEDGQHRLLDTDTYVVLPINTKIRLLIAADDVIHAFALPSMGVKLDAVPGRINETWIEITREGTFYGQCSEICGSGHSYMPIAVKAVSKDAYAAWVETAKEEYARVDEPNAATRVAQAGLAE
ncbi:MAG: cytochrome c oxidase subunit II [Alphaproteobacteria bacterium]